MGVITHNLERMPHSGLLECTVRGTVAPRILASTMVHRALVESLLLAVFRTDPSSIDILGLLPAEYWMELRELICESVLCWLLRLVGHRSGIQRIRPFSRA